MMWRLTTRTTPCKSWFQCEAANECLYTLSSSQGNKGLLRTESTMTKAAKIPNVVMHIASGTLQPVPHCDENSVPESALQPTAHIPHGQHEGTHTCLSFVTTAKTVSRVHAKATTRSELIGWIATVHVEHAAPAPPGSTRHEGVWGKKREGVLTPYQGIYPSL